jgi:hypothetical protein
VSGSRKANIVSVIEIKLEFFIAFWRVWGLPFGGFDRNLLHNFRKLDIKILFWIPIRRYGLDQFSQNRNRDPDYDFRKMFESGFGSHCHRFLAAELLYAYDIFSGKKKSASWTSFQPQKAENLEEPRVIDCITLLSNMNGFEFHQLPPDSGEDIIGPFKVLLGEMASSFCHKS